LGQHIYIQEGKYTVSGLLYGQPVFKKETLGAYIVFSQTVEIFTPGEDYIIHFSAG
jgi:hypothetical protein